MELNQIFYTVLPLIIAILAYKWPRITLILICILLKWWLALIGVIIVSIIAKVSINMHKMTKEEYEEYKSNLKEEEDDS